MFKVKSDDFGHPDLNAKFKMVVLHVQNRQVLVRLSRGWRYKRERNKDE